MTTGTIGHQLKNVTKNSEICYVRNFQTSNEFRLMISDDYLGVYAVLISGLAVSFFFFIAEIVFFIIIKYSENSAL
jgi:hypothetical protein